MVRRARSRAAAPNRGCRQRPSGGTCARCRPHRRRRRHPGPDRRPAHGRRLRRGVRRGQALVVGLPRRRQDRGAARRVATVAPASGSSWARPPASPTPPTCPRPVCSVAAEAAAAAARGAGAAARHGGPHPQRGAAAPARSQIAPGRRRQGHQGRRCSSGPTSAARAAGGVIRAGVGQLRRQPPPHPRRQLRRAAHRATTRCARCSASAPWRSGDTGMQTGRESIGHTIGFELFDRYDVEDLARAGRRARAHQARRPARAHRRAARRHRRRAAAACCSTRRAATASRPTSSPRAPRCSQDRVGEQVASPLVTLVDDGTVATEWGAFGFDDEGTPAQRNVLIQDGVLTDYMWDFLRSRKEGRARSGNGRRQSYQHLPMVRMTNTFILDGPDDPADDRLGHRARRLRGPARWRPGQHRHRRLRLRHDRGLPDRERRDHRAAARGQPHRQRPRGAPEHRRRGQRLRHGPPGTCGKDGQGVPVGDGVPTLRVAALTIGGTAA